MTFAAEQLLWVVYNLFVKPVWAVFNLLYVAMFIAVAFVFFKKYLKTERAAKEQKYDNDSFKYLRSLSDKYAKRRLNGIALLVGAAFIFVFSELNFYIFGNSKSAELVENFFSNFTWVQVPLYICIKNFLCFKIVNGRISLPDSTRYKKHLWGMRIFSLCYWVAVLAVVTIAEVSYPANVITIAAVIFAALAGLYNLILRRKITFKNIVFNKPRFAAFTAVAVAGSAFTVMQRETWYTQSYIN